MRILFNTKTGGYTRCNSPKKRIGKGNCYHILDGEIEGKVLHTDEGEDIPLTNNQLEGLADQVDIDLEGEGNKIKLVQSEPTISKIVIHSEEGTKGNIVEMEDSIDPETGENTTRVLPEIEDDIKYPGSIRECEKLKKKIEKYHETGEWEGPVDLLFNSDQHLKNIEYKISMLKRRNLESASRDKRRTFNEVLAPRLSKEGLQKAFADKSTKFFSLDKSATLVHLTVQSVDGKHVVAVDRNGNPIEGTEFELIHKKSSRPFGLTAIDRSGIREFPAELNKRVSGKPSPSLQRISRGKVREFDKVAIIYRGVPKVHLPRSTRVYKCRIDQCKVRSYKVSETGETEARLDVLIPELGDGYRAVRIRPGDVAKIKAAKEFQVRQTSQGLEAYYKGN